VQARTTIFLIAGNRLLREALTRILNKRSDLSVVGAVPFSPQAAEQVATAGAEILLLDSVTTAISDLEFIREVRQTVPNLKVILIGMEHDEEMFLKAVRSGAVGYVLKDASAMDVVAAVRAVAQEEAVCPPRLCLSLLNYVARQWVEMPNVRVRLQLGLTRREQQLVPLIAQGLTNKEIAAQLRISEQTVKNHIHRILQKVGASDRLAVVELCRIQGFVI
jgi:DNA-binding NarL/FixJ family response regulator